MANVNPTFYSDHHTPRRTDPRLIVLQKILGATIDNAGGAGVAEQEAGPVSGWDPPDDPTQTTFKWNSTDGIIYVWNVDTQAWEPTA